MLLENASGGAGLRKLGPCCDENILVNVTGACLCCSVAALLLQAQASLRDGAGGICPPYPAVLVSSVSRLSRHFTAIEWGKIQLACIVHALSCRGCGKFMPGRQHKPAVCLNPLHHEVWIALPLPEVCGLQIMSSNLEGQFLSHSETEDSWLSADSRCAAARGNLRIRRLLSIGEELAKRRVAGLPVRPDRAMHRCLPGMLHYYHTL